MIIASSVTKVLRCRRAKHISNSSINNHLNEVLKQRQLVASYRTVNIITTRQELHNRNINRLHIDQICFKLHNSKHCHRHRKYWTKAHLQETSKWPRSQTEHLKYSLNSRIKICAKYLSSIKICQIFCNRF